MEAEHWVLVAVAVAAALAIGFVAGRFSAPTQRRVEEMARERDAAKAEVESVRKEVNRHFEESARMFGKLASDYRSFFQQFTRTAQNLGLSEGHARSLLQQADPSLVADKAPAQRPAAATDADGSDPAGQAQAGLIDDEGPVQRTEAAADTGVGDSADRPRAAAGGDADAAEPRFFADEAPPQRTRSSADTDASEAAERPHEESGDDAAPADESGDSAAGERRNP